MPNLSSTNSYGLVKLGLTKQEARIYQILVEEGPMNAIQLSQKIKILPNAVYRLINKLQEKNFVTTTEKGRRTFKAIPPTIAVKAYSNNKILEIEKLKDQAIENLIKGKTKTTETQVNFINSRQEIFNQSIVMIKQAKKEILIISIGESIPDELILTNRDALNRGVAVKMIAHKYDAGNEQLLKSWIKMGWQVRHYPDWGFHLVIVDGITSILSVNNPKNTEDRIGLQFFSTGLSKALKDYFYFIWEKSIKV
jgi:sugar-specific transcriptional regulator TrmB